MTFQDDLGRAGLDPAAIRRAPDRPMADNCAAFAAGAMDVVQLFEPCVDRLVQAGVGHVWHRFADRGDIGYTTFVAMRDTLCVRRHAIVRLVKGFAAALVALHNATPQEIASALAGFFPELSQEQLARMTGAYRASAVWPATPDLPPSAFVRLKAALLSGGLIGRDIPYDSAVDTALSSADPH